MLTPHCSAPSAMVAPPSIASTTRLRKSSEYGFAIHAGLLPVASLNHIRARMGIPDSAFSGNALVERGTSPAQIADIIGVTLGTLKTTCSKLHISLRRPSYDTGTGLLRHRRPRADGGPSGEPLNSRTHADASNQQLVTLIEKQPMEQEPTLVPQDKAPRNPRPLATIAIVMQYRGEKHIAELPLTPHMI